jgi:hypothetical protein
MLKGFSVILYIVLVYGLAPKNSVYNIVHIAVIKMEQMEFYFTVVGGESAKTFI